MKTFITLLFLLFLLPFTAMATDYRPPAFDPVPVQNIKNVTVESSGAALAIAVAMRRAMV